MMETPEQKSLWVRLILAVLLALAVVCFIIALLTIFQQVDWSVTAMFCITAAIFLTIWLILTLKKPKPKKVIIDVRQLNRRDSGSGFALGLILSLIFFNLIGLALFVATWRAVWLVRRRRAAAVLVYTEQAIRLNLPLPQMIDAAARSETGTLQARLMDFHALLQDGLPLDEALARGVPEMPDDACRNASAGLRIGRLPSILARITRQLQPDPSEIAANDFYAIYGILLLCAIFVITGMVFAFVMPKFRSIFLDFHIQLPWTMRLLLWAGNSDWAMPVISLILGIIVLGAITYFFVTVFFPPGSRRVVSSLLDRLLWNVPVYHRFAEQRGLADLCELVSEAAIAGTPLDEALVQAAGIQRNFVMHERVSRWARGVGSGERLEQAARAAQMPGLVVGLLGTARNSDDIVQTFAFLYRHYDSAFSRLHEALREMYVPVVVVTLGVIVGWIATSLFMSMAALLNAVDPFHGGF
jgi:type II secretory pathway component PulF